MANQDHIDMIMLSEDELRRWHDQDHQNNILDLCDADFKGKTISDAWLAYANLENANFKGAKLDNVHFGYANLIGANFEGATLKGVYLGNVKDFTGVNFKKTKFIDTGLFNLDLSNLNFENADLSYANINGVNFDNSLFSGTNFYEAVISNVSFKNSRGLHKAKYLVTTTLSGAAKYFEFCERSIVTRFIDWERLRVLGKLPIFGASYLALFSIPLFFYILAKYNEYIEVIRLWASNVGSSNPEYIVNLTNVITSKLNPVAVPEQSLLLLSSTIMLAIGATLYTFFCPSRIKEFSRDQWVDQFGKSLFQYWPLAWRFPFVRVICVLSYLIGGMGIIWVIGGKLIDVAIFIIRYA